MFDPMLIARFESYHFPQGFTRTAYQIAGCDFSLRGLGFPVRSKRCCQTLRLPDLPHPYQFVLHLNRLFCKSAGRFRRLSVAGGQGLGRWKGCLLFYAFAVHYVVKVHTLKEPTRTNLIW